jgi:hypothetical protein
MPPSMLAPVQATCTMSMAADTGRALLAAETATGTVAASLRWQFSSDHGVPTPSPDAYESPAETTRGRYPLGGTVEVEVEVTVEVVVVGRGFGTVGSGGSGRQGGSGQMALAG